MQRHHLFELADEPWLPTALKDGVTDNLQLGLNLLQPYKVVAPHLVGLLQTMDADAVLDLGSGGSGPWKSMKNTLRELGCEPRVVLSDLQPSPERFEQATADAEGVEYWPEPADARDIPAGLRDIRVRTMFTALHHLRENEVEDLVACCVRDGVGFGAFEFTERRPREVVLSFFTAFSTTIIFAPTMWRGWSLRGLAKWSTRILLSPLIALINGWDGAVSVARSYTPDEVRSVLSRVPGADGYTWKIGLESAPGLSSRVMYVVGWPGAE